MKKNIVKLSMLLSISLLTFGCEDELLTKLESASYVYPDSKDVFVTIDLYEKIEAGMTQSQVWEILGGECTETGVTNTALGDEYITESYGCNAEGTIGANVVLVFQGGKLTTKTQSGLQ
ncbi:MAG: hypothetical protein R3Y13_04275 [bacterium]